MAQIVINAKERRAAFWKFLLFFLLAVGIILTAFYFDTLVPARENEMMRTQIAKLKIQQTAQEKFINTMDETKILIDSLRSPAANIAYLNSQISANIRQLSELQYKDSSVFARLNTSVVDLFQRYNEATNLVAKLGNKPQELEKLRTDNAQLQRDLLQCTQAVRSLQGSPMY
ncbi:hypothetical protein GCM10027051_15260 [Niabella terrae]